MFNMKNKDIKFQLLFHGPTLLSKLHLFSMFLLVK